MNEMITQTAKTTCFVNIPHCHTRSALLINFMAAPNSKNPMVTFTEFSHPPDLGNLARYWGKSARKKNGNANAVENTTMPKTGQKNAP